MNFRHFLNVSMLALVLPMHAAMAHDDHDDIDVQGNACEITLPAGYQLHSQVDDCQDDKQLITVTKDNKQGLATLKGQIIIEPNYQEIYDFDDGLALIRQNDKYGFIDKTGKIVIKPQFDDAWGFSEGYAKIKQNDKFGFIDKTGKIVIKPTLNQVSDWFFNGLAVVAINDKFGFINKQGKVQITPKYNIAHDFAEGLALVAMADASDNNRIKYGYIDKTGKVIVPLQFDYAYDFFKGTATVLKNGRIYYINKIGARVDAPNLQDLR